MNADAGVAKPAQQKFDLQLEFAVIGSILVDARCMEDIRPLVRPKDFQLALCRSAYAAACALEDAGEQVDLMTISAKSKTMGVELPLDFLTQCMDVTPTAAHAKSHAALLRDQGERQQLRRIAEETLAAIDQGERTTTEITTAISKALDNVDGGAGDLLTSTDAMLEFMDYRAAMDRGETAAVVKTGFDSLDQMLGGGMIPQGLYLLGARPSVGKTAMGLAIADNVAAQGLPVLYVTLEMTTMQISARRIARASGVSTTALMARDLNEKQWTKTLSAAEDLSKRPLAINRTPHASMDELLRMARGYRGRQLVVIDYVGLLDKRDLRTSSYEHMSEVSRQLKMMANNYGIPVLALAQLNREVDKRPSQVPQLSDLRDSGTLEQDADGVMMLYRPAMYVDEEDKPQPWAYQELKVIVCKNRHGETGTVSLSYQPMTGCIKDGKVAAAPKKAEEKQFSQLPITEEVPF